MIERLLDAGVRLVLFRVDKSAILRATLELWLSLLLGGVEVY